MTLTPELKAQGWRDIGEIKGVEDNPLHKVEIMLHCSNGIPYPTAFFNTEYFNERVKNKDWRKGDLFRILAPVMPEPPKD